MSLKYLVFDVAETLLGKPSLVPSMHAVFTDWGYELSEDLIRDRLRLLTEAIDFPPKTSREFYRDFNQRLLATLGLPPKPDLAEALFDACTYKPWEPFADTDVLLELSSRLPIGILSNWDTSLRERLSGFFPGVSFGPILVSAEEGCAKPQTEFYQRLLQRLGNPDPASVGYVGDSPRLDMAPAAAIGLSPVLIDRHGHFPAYPGLRVSSLHQLPTLLA